MSNWRKHWALQDGECYCFSPTHRYLLESGRIIVTHPVKATIQRYERYGNWYVYLYRKAEFTTANRNTMIEKIAACLAMRSHVIIPKFKRRCNAKRYVENWWISSNNNATVYLTLDII